MDVKSSVSLVNNIDNLEHIKLLHSIYVLNELGGNLEIKNKDHLNITFSLEFPIIKDEKQSVHLDNNLSNTKRASDIKKEHTDVLIYKKSLLESKMVSSLLKEKKNQIIHNVTDINNYNFNTIIFDKELNISEEIIKFTNGKNIKTVMFYDPLSKPIDNEKENINFLIPNNDDLKNIINLI
jgi:hypothetical protein